MRKSLLAFFFLFFVSTGIALGSVWSRASLWGADVRALIIDPAHPDVLYLGTSHGEIYASRDAGKTWTNPRQSVPFPGYVVDNLLVDGKGRLWAASWGLWGGGVVAVSDDGGVSWSRRDAGLEDFSVRAIAVDARNPDLVFVGGLTGVYRSRDAGRTWQKISDRQNVESLALDPRSSDRLYVGTWRQAWRTDDGGKSWKHINEGMVLDTDVFAISIDPLNPDSVWLSTCGWVYNSANRGDNWVRFKEGFNNRRIHAVAIDPRDSQSVYAGSVAGLYRTRDAGKGWELVSGEDFVVNAIALHKDRPNRIVLATERDGVYVSADAGKTFTRSSYGLRNLRIAAVAPDPEIRGRVYAAVLFGGNASGIYQSTNGGESWERLNSTRLPEVLTLVVRRDAEPKFLAGTEQGFFWSRDGREWTKAEPQLLPVRVDKILPYNSSRVFAATAEGVLTSSDGGKSWARLGEARGKTIDIALGTFDGKRALYALSSNGLSVFDGKGWFPIKEGPERARSLAVATDGGREMLVVAGLQGVRAGRIDATHRWNEVSAPKLNHASVLEAGDFSRRSVYLSSRETLDLYRAGAGEEWQLLSLPAGSLDVATIAEDPFEPGRVYVGTGGQGIFIYGKKPAQSAAPETPYSVGGRK